MKRFIAWLTRPKITLFFKNGDFHRFRDCDFYEFCINHKELLEDFNSLLANIIDGDCVLLNEIYRISVRKWYQPWA